MLNLKKALCAAAVGADVAAASAAPALAQSGGPSVREVRADQNGYGGDVGIAVGGSQILRFAQPVGRIMIGDPEEGAGG